MDEHNVEQEKKHLVNRINTKDVERKDEANKVN